MVSAPGDPTGARRPRELLWRAVGVHRRDVLAASLLYSGHQIGESLVPVIIGAVVGQAIAHGGTVRIAVWLGVLAADFAVLSSCYRFGARASVRAKQGSEHAVRLWLTARAVDPGGGLDQPPGQLLSRASSDASRVGAFAGLVAFVVSRLVVLITTVVLLLRFSPILAAVIGAGTLALVLVQDRVSAVLRRRAGVEQQQVADATALAEDLVRGLRVLKGVGAEPAAAARYRRTSRTALHAGLRAASAEAALSGAAALVTGVYLTVIVGVGGWLALSGRLGVGPLVAALGLAQFIRGPMQAIASVSAVYARACASAARIAEILRQPPATAGGGHDPRAAGRPVPPPPVRFEQVRVAGASPSAGPDAGFGPISFTAAAGALTGLVVADPAVAASVPALLAREAAACTGAVSVGGVPVEQWDLDALRATVLVSPHDAALFDGTVLENIAAGGDPEAAAVRRASRAAFADQVIDTLPDGGDTAVGDRGQNLSGGQRQRVALARALAADPPALVLHDPTTSVDAATENRIAARLRQLRAGRTTLLVTTSPALLAQCDAVVFLDPAGAAAGLHAQLLAGNERYRQRVAR